MNLSKSLTDEISSAVAGSKIPASIVAAVCWVESSGDVTAWRPEHAYRYLWDVRRNAPFRPLTLDERDSETPPADFYSLAGAKAAEWWGQQASWGPMQIMGAVARELGFTGQFPGLCSAFAGVLYGCKHLENLHKRFFERYGWDGVVAAYNAGSPRLVDRRFQNQEYVDKINSALKSMV